MSINQETTQKIQNDKKQRVHKESEKWLGNVWVVNGVPEWLKIYSEKKNIMLKEFEEMITDFINTDNTNLLIFNFSFAKEQTNKFLRGIFGESIFNDTNNRVKFLKMNPLTQKVITEKLQQIVEDRKIILKVSLKDIVDNCNKDIRNAIQTLQFYAIGNTHNNTFTTFKSKRVNNKGTQSQFMSEKDFFGHSSDEEDASVNHIKASWELDKSKFSSKDNGLDLFHAIGKFMYNKRVEPGSGKERSMTSTEMNQYKERHGYIPKSYINHLDVMNQVLIEKSTFSLFLEENMYDFFTDIEDISKVLQVYSETDSMRGGITYSYSEQKAIYEIEENCAHVEALAITEYNMHGADNKGEKRKMKKFVKPVWFDKRREIIKGNQLIFDTAKVDQILSKNIISEFLLTSPQRQICTEYLPYLKKMGMFRKIEFMKPFEELTTFSRYGGSSYNTEIGENEGFEGIKAQNYQDEVLQANMFANKMKKKKELGTAIASNALMLPEVKNNVVEEEIEDSSEEDKNDSIWDLNSEDIEAILKDEDELNDSDLDAVFNNTPDSNGKNSKNQSNASSGIKSEDLLTP